MPAPIATQSFEVMIPASQTIDFSVISNKWTTDLPFDVEATASSDLPVEFSIVSGPATINGNTITLDGVEGEVVVQADQSGDVGFFPAPSVTQSFNVLLEVSTFDPINELDILLKTYPNPFEKLLVADYTLNDAEKLEVSIVNISGIRLYHQEWEHPSLQNQLTIDTTEFPSGIYKLIFKQGNKQKVVKITKVNH